MISAAFKDTPMPSSFDSVLLCALALFIPPLPVYLLTFPRSKLSTREFWICVIFTIFLYAGGVLYSIYFLLVMFPDARRQNDYFPSGDLESNEQDNNHNHTSYSEAHTSEQNSRPSGAAVLLDPSMADVQDVKPLLPSYNEASAGDSVPHTPIDVKSCDHKVQK